VSSLAMLGGHEKGRIGEISLAHQGVLFLDEATEFDSNILRAVSIALSKRWETAENPFGLLSATVLCVACVQPCPCGYRGSQTRNCRCSEDAIRLYRLRLRPLIEHIDLKVDLSGAHRGEEQGPNEPSVVVRARVTAARERQIGREPSLTRFLRTNGLLNMSQVRVTCTADAIELAGGDARMSLAILRVARSIADLAGDEKVEVVHVEEARRYQPSWP